MKPDSVQLVLVGAFPEPEENCRRFGVGFRKFGTTDEVLAAMPNLGSARLFLLPFFMQSMAAVDLVTLLRLKAPIAEFWIATGQDLALADERWLRMNLCDRFVSYPVDFDAVRAAVEGTGGGK